MSKDLTTKVKLELANQAFNQQELLSTPSRRYCTLVCLVLDQMIKDFFEKKNIVSTGFPDCIFSIGQDNTKSKQFKLSFNISYDEILVTLKGIVIENSSNISLNIYFENKVTNEEELVHFDFVFGKEGEKKDDLLKESVEQLEQLFKSNFFEKFFEKKENRKDENTTSNRNTSNPENPLIDNNPLRVPPRNPRYGNPRQPYPYPGNPGIFPNQPYPGLTPYIRYGRKLFITKNLANPFILDFLLQDIFTFNKYYDLFEKIQNILFIYLGKQILKFLLICRPG